MRRNVSIGFVSIALAIGAACPEFADGGGVKRRLTIRSNPPGAMVYVDNEPIGKTPISTYFTYYGTREIRLVKEGCETLTDKLMMLPPWYEIPGVDFVSENFVPGEIDDRRTVDYRLMPQRIVPRDELMERANAFREEVQRQATYVPPPPMAPSTSNPYSPPGGFLTPGTISAADPFAVGPPMPSNTAPIDPRSNPYPSTSSPTPAPPAGYPLLQPPAEFGPAIGPVPSGSGAPTPSTRPTFPGPSSTTGGAPYLGYGGRTIPRLPPATIR